MSTPPRSRATLPKLASVDLNLLVALDALLRDGSVTAAGKRIGLSQPAMSQALARLRLMLGDALLVREGRVMRATQVAEQLAPRVRRLVSDIEATLLGDRTFDAAKSSRTFRLATNDYCGLVLLPEVLSRMRHDAPGVGLDVRAHRGDAPVQELARGELDAAVGVFLRIEEDLGSRELFRERFVCVVRKGHPLGRQRLSVDRYAKLEHVLVSAPDDGPGVVDHALAAHRLARRVTVRVPHFFVAPALVARTNLVLTIPERVARLAADLHGLRVIAPPLELPDFAVQVVWHKANDTGAANVWVRELLQRAADALAPRDP
jgi:DNA-binding transcriptional LysR family regulator